MSWEMLHRGSLLLSGAAFKLRSSPSAQRELHSREACVRLGTLLTPTHQLGQKSLKLWLTLVTVTEPALLLLHGEHGTAMLSPHHHHFQGLAMQSHG